MESNPNPRKSLSDIAFSIDGVEKVAIQKIDEDRYSVKTNLNLIPAIVSNCLEVEQIEQLLRESFHGKAPPRKDPGYKTRQDVLALLVDVSMNVVIGWTKTSIPSGRIVVDINDTTRTPMFITRDRARYGGGADSLDQCSIIQSQDMTPSTDLLEISASWSEK